MNRSLTFIIALIAGISIHAQDPLQPPTNRTIYPHAISFSIKGTILNADNSKKIYLSGVIDREIKLKAGNRFEINGDAGSPGQLRVRTDNSHECTIWLGQGKTELTLTEYTTPMRDTTGKKYLKVVNLSGPSETESYQIYMRRWDELVSSYHHLDFRVRRDSAAAVFYPEIADYVSKNRSSSLSTYLLQRFPFTIEQKQALLAMINPGIGPLYDIIDENLARSALLKPGTVLPDFKQKMTDGTDFNLYDVKGKYILLQFWDSECTSCRENNADLQAIYTEYHPKGLEIVSVSMDKSKGSWKYAVTEDALPWRQVSDLKGSRNAIASAYNINSVPFNILLNSKYEVVSSGLPVMALPERLKYLFKQ